MLEYVVWAVEINEGILEFSAFTRSKIIDPVSPIRCPNPQ